MLQLVTLNLSLNLYKFDRTLREMDGYIPNYVLSAIRCI